MSNSITPIFIFSLPRSGSTLLQRIIAAHPQVSTASETWLLLPLVYALRKGGTYAEYSHDSMCGALNEFIDALPGTRTTYLRLLGEFASELYRECSKEGCLYFLDKTPRYHLIVNEIIEIFPRAKFIFLWRNPIAIIASALDTFGKGGRWRLYDYRIDFYKGLENLHTTYLKHQAIVHAINYESLLSSPEDESRRLFNYLELERDIPDINDFTNVKLSGGAGDPTGTRDYSKVSTEPLQKWKTSLCNPIRQGWTKAYINWVGKTRLADMGYNYNHLLEELNTANTSHYRMMSDTVRISYGLISTLLESHILRDKFHKLPNWKQIFSHK